MDLTFTIPAGLAATCVTVMFSKLINQKMAESKTRRAAFAAHVKECDERREGHAGLEEKVNGLEKRMEQGFNDTRNQLHEISENMRRFVR